MRCIIFTMLTLFYSCIEVDNKIDEDIFYKIVATIFFGLILYIFYNANKELRIKKFIKEKQKEEDEKIQREINKKLLDKLDGGE